MSVEDLKPEGFTPEMEKFAHLTGGIKVSAQGMIGGLYSIWATHPSGAETMLGYGSAKEALFEATFRLQRLSVEARTGLESLMRAKDDHSILPPRTESKMLVAVNINGSPNTPNNVRIIYDGASVFISKEEALSLSEHLFSAYHHLDALDCKKALGEGAA